MSRPLLSFLFSFAALVSGCAIDPTIEDELQPQADPECACPEPADEMPVAVQIVGSCETIGTVKVDGPVIYVVEERMLLQYSDDPDVTLWTAGAARVWHNDGQINVICHEGVTQWRLTVLDVDGG